MHARGLRLRRVRDRLALAPAAVLPSATWYDVGTLDAIISQLNTLPTCAPVNASMVALRLATHDSGSGWIASPFLYDSFIHDSTPVYPGAHHELSRGTLDLTIVHPRDVIRIALLTNASVIVVGHNHPSGDVAPSLEDLAVTKRLSAAAEVIGITLADHIIVNAAGEYYSFRDAGLI